MRRVRTNRTLALIGVVFAFALVAACSSGSDSATDDTTGTTLPAETDVETTQGQHDQEQATDTVPPGDAPDWCADLIAIDERFADREDIDLTGEDADAQFEAAVNESIAAFEDLLSNAPSEIRGDLETIRDGMIQWRDGDESVFMDPEFDIASERFEAYARSTCNYEFVG